MDHLAIPQQVLVEHQTLAYVTSALRATIGWKFQGADLSRKLSSLRFVGQSFQRHLKHLMELEEEDGYMSVVLAERPELTDEVEALRQEHDRFRKALSRILRRLRRVEPTDHAAFAKISDDLLALLEKLDEHSRRETDLLQHALLEDNGGEG
ncbi:MAG: hemerythrin domain-containing protein [Planctomycetia bacterium]|nr:hemerythrin domain-containing protein [Planctomycetia bacterium]